MKPFLMVLLPFPFGSMSSSSAAFCEANRCGRFFATFLSDGTALVAGTGHFTGVVRALGGDVVSRVRGVG